MTKEPDICVGIGKSTSGCVAFGIADGVTRGNANGKGGGGEDKSLP
jgi:hypothetical protein